MVCHFWVSRLKAERLYLSLTLPSHPINCHKSDSRVLIRRHTNGARILMTCPRRWQAPLLHVIFLDSNALFLPMRGWERKNVLVQAKNRVVPISFEGPPRWKGKHTTIISIKEKTMKFHFHFRTEKRSLCPLATRYNNLIL